jgi:hypothetical protein
MAGGLFPGCAAFKPQPPTIIVVRESAAPACPELGIAYLRVLRVAPFSQVEINGRVLGQTPMEGYLSMPAGVSRVSVLHTYFPPLDTLVELQAGEYRVIRFPSPRDSL